MLCNVLPIVAALGEIFGTGVHELQPHSPQATPNIQSKGKEHPLYVNAALRPQASLKQNPVSQPTYCIGMLVAY